MKFRASPKQLIAYAKKNNIKVKLFESRHLAVITIFHDGVELVAKLGKKSQEWKDFEKDEKKNAIDLSEFKASV